VFHYIEDPFSSNIDSNHWQSTLAPLGIEVAAYRVHCAGYSAAKVSAAISHTLDLVEQDALVADAVLVLHELGFDYTGKRAFVREVLIPNIEFEADVGDLSAIEYQDALIGRLEIAHDAPSTRLPKFTRCYFTVIQGRTGDTDLPPDRFVDCVVEEFGDEASTTNAFLELALPMGTRVLLTVLKKIYAQRGRGRRESALLRGLDHRARPYVNPVLALLRREGFLTKARMGEHTVWLPVRSADAQRRANRILSAPHVSNDSLVLQAGDL
jgi:hypothetical protein